MKKYKRLVAKVYEPTKNVHGEAAEEPKYVITPKGCATLAIAEAEIELRDEDQFNLFWDKFQEYMQNAGYIEE